ncbi:unnamed protein product [Caenorhabditis sp. 36 PRJEB53466]|nr:unnamed protein product [Caenorhabditis sp. 36 PRJEB53466]
MPALDDLSINFDQPDRKYLPGEKVSGEVTLLNTEPLAARFLKIYWSGIAKTDWFFCADTFTRKKFFSDYKIAWCSKDGSNKLPAGKHVFPFSFVLPEGCSPSISGKYANIAYCVRVVVDRPWKLSNFKLAKNFVVTQETDFSAEPEKLKSWWYSILSKSGLVFKDGLVKIKMKMPKVAFAPGESFTVKVLLENMSTKPIASINIRLFRLCHAHSRPQLAPCKSPFSKECPLDLTRQKFESKEVATFKKLPFGVDAMSKKTLEFELKVPDDAVPSFRDSLMTVTYQICLDTPNNYPMYARFEVGELAEKTEKKDAPPPYQP